MALRSAFQTPRQAELPKGLPVYMTMAVKHAATRAKRARMQATRKLNGTWARLIKCRYEERKKRWLAPEAADQLRFVISSGQSAGRFFQAAGRYQKRFR
eukprot:8692821-Alexandrium_andersonii.AAC.1